MLWHRLDINKVFSRWQKVSAKSSIFNPDSINLDKTLLIHSKYLHEVNLIMINYLNSLFIKKFGQDVNRKLRILSFFEADHYKPGQGVLNQVPYQVYSWNYTLNICAMTDEECLDSTPSEHPGDNNPLFFTISENFPLFFDRIEYVVNGQEDEYWRYCGKRYSDLPRLEDALKQQFIFWKNRYDFQLTAACDDLWTRYYKFLQELCSRRYKGNRINTSKDCASVNYDLIKIIINPRILQQEVS